jgi:hypothetical protein
MKIDSRILTFAAACSVTAAVATALAQAPAADTQPPAAQPPAAEAAKTPPKPPPPPKVIDTGVSANPRSGKEDPRIGLKAGLYDAGEAAFGLERLASLPKPSGFAPGDVVVTPGPPPPEPPPPGANADAAARLPQAAPNAYGSTNSDLAFQGNHLFVGNYNGINFYDVDNPRKVKLMTSLLCPGGQGDVSVYGNLLFMSAEAMNGRTDCGVQGIPLPPGYVAPKPEPPPPPPANGQPAPRRQRPLPPPSPDRFRGVRIFDISDLANPKQVAAVQSCRGSHTHSLLIDPKDKENVYVYISGTSQVRQGEELSGCVGGAPDKNPETALFRIDIIKVPLAHPEQAKIVSSPRIFTDTQTGAMNGLNKGGNSGEGTQRMSETNQCHDITIFASAGLAAGACSGNGILLDISNPINPVRIDAVSDPNYSYWHSANFNNAGTKVLFTDEWGGGAQPRCRENDPMSWGADAIFTLKDRKLTLASYYKMPAAQTEYENCVAHNGSIVPVPGRDILVQAWYQGGISVVDFTDAAHPFEIAYFDRGPIDATKRAMGGQWSTYWYNGYIYGAEIARGVDVMRLLPTKFLTQNEIDAANQVHFDYLNVQNQPKVEWPSNLIVARAYVDQLARGSSLSSQAMADLTAAVGKSGGGVPSKFKSVAAELEKAVPGAKSPADADRLKALAAILKQQK